MPKETRQALQCCFSIKRSIWATSGAIERANGQVDAWAGVRRGTQASLSALVDESPADAAIARMMLHRRRAVIPMVINEFSERARSIFTPYPANLAPQEAVDLSGEIAAAKAAAHVVESPSGNAKLPSLKGRLIPSNVAYLTTGFFSRARSMERSETSIQPMQPTSIG
jgi:hypothetical protein